MAGGGAEVGASDSMDMSVITCLLNFKILLPPLLHIIVIVRDYIYITKVSSTYSPY